MDFKRVALIVAVVATCGTAFAQGGGSGSTGSENGAENKDPNGMVRPGASSAPTPPRHHRMRHAKKSASAPAMAASK
ncbi:MAG TPA: hypothetical protein VH328_05035 [Burkholderiaceae bacterium]|jgi:hypothetical protein|nr:hypothetical protein [Burkholderiaceae bacterium]